MVLQTTYINLDALHKICNGDKDKKLRYLKQFLEMIPLSIQKLKLATEKGDRTEALKVLHFMSPQLVFFGINDISVLLKRERENKGLSFEMLRNQIEIDIIKIEKALEEVDGNIKNKSNNSIR